MFKTVKRYYDARIYSKSDVAKFVLANKITPDEYRLITNEEYINQ